MVSLINPDDQTVAAFVQASKEVTPDVVHQLLRDFNWRTRIVGAYFAAVKGHEGFTDILGIHLLRSEVCYAGAGYALAFAVFRSEKAKDYLAVYLDYYLKQLNLWYDQADFLAALHLLDPTAAATRSADWRAYTVNKPNHRLEVTIDSLWSRIATVQQIRTTSLK